MYLAKKFSITYLLNAKKPILRSEVIQAIRHTDPINLQNCLLSSKYCLPSKTPATVKPSTNPLIRRSARDKLNTNIFVVE